MTKKKNLIARICGLLIVLTLISCCFLGSTFARYTTGVDGTASVQVAKWDIDITDAESSTTIAATFGKLSPSMNGFDNGNSSESNTTNLTQIATITNRGEVNALVTIVPSAKITSITTANGTYTADNWNAGYAYTFDQIAALFTIQVYCDDSASAVPEDGALCVAGGKISLYGTATWTTDYSGSTGDQGATADALDTWVGENVISVGWDITITAVQSSELPA